jgi:hypothetical protein
MALSVTQTAALGHVLKSGMKVASMGYPDIIANIEPMVGLEYRGDSAKICKRHGLPPRDIPDAHSYFKLKGCELHVYDVVQERGCERLCDLNNFGELRYAQGFYDVVLDVGTAEHCFNIGQALINMAGLVKVGGYIIHENPFNCGNHGFYNLNPTLFVDFYGVNGFEVVDCKLVDRAGNEARVPLTGRFRFFEKEVNTFALARRLGAQKMVYPVQSKYAGVIPVAGVRAEHKEVVNG